MFICVQDAVDRGWLYTSRASHFTGVTDLRKLLLTALELANALAYLHSVDVMHGDLTGGNVLLHSSPITSTDPRGFIVKVWCLLPTLHSVTVNCMLLLCWSVHACINFWFFESLGISCLVHDCCFLFHASSLSPE